QAQGVQVESNGHIAVGGRTGTDGFGLARYNSDGSLDTSFNGTGTLRYYTPGETFNAGYALGIAGSNFVVAGNINGDFGVILVDPPVGGGGAASNEATPSPSFVSASAVTTARQGIIGSLTIALPPSAVTLPGSITASSPLNGSVQPR